MEIVSVEKGTAVKAFLVSFRIDGEFVEAVRNFIQVFNLRLFELSHPFKHNKLSIKSAPHFKIMHKHTAL